MISLKKFALTVMLIITLLAPSFLKAQPGLEDENVLDNPVPFDGGVSCLVAATVLYGLHKVRSRKTNQFSE